MSHDHLSEQFQRAERAYLTPPDAPEPTCCGYGCVSEAVPDRDLCEPCDARFVAAGEHDSLCPCGECDWWEATRCAIESAEDDGVQP